MAEREMKGEAKELYEKIRRDLVRLHADWQIFKQLFTKSDERYATLNNTAPGFFRLIRDMLVDNAVISLSRLTDPKSFESLVRLVMVLKSQIDHELHSELELALADIQLKCEDIRQHRDRRVAHSERSGGPPTFEGGPTQLPPITRKKIEGAMADMAELMNKALGAFTGDYQIYEPAVTGDSEALVFYLEKGLEVTRPPDQIAR